MPPLVEVEDLHHSFPDGWDALNGVSLTIAEGERVALIGRNGSGKTTLAKHLNGLLRPTRGRVIVAGVDTREVEVGALARQVGYAFQNPDHQIFASTVIEELAFGPTVQGVPPLEVRQRVAAELEAFGLEQVASQPPAILPPGLRRKVAIASVLTSHPRLLILDEPTVGLDAWEQREVFDRVALYSADGNTVLLITHDMNLVARWACRCLLLEDGRLLADNLAARVLCDVSALAKAGMKAPPLARLGHALADLGMPQGHLSPSDFAAAFLALLGGCP